MTKYITLLLFLIGNLLSAQITFTNYTADDGLVNNFVNAVSTDSEDNVWFGTQEGVSRFDGTTFTNYTTDTHPELVSNTVTAVFADADGAVWIGTDFGLNKFDGTTWLTYTDENGLADNRVKHINQSTDGRIWVANQDGISILTPDDGSWVSYIMADGIPFGGTNYVAFTADGTALLSTPLSGVLAFDDTNLTAITEEEGLLSDNVRSVAVAPDNNIWIGTADGISVFDAQYNFLTHHEIIFELPPPDELNPVEDIVISAGGRVWAAVYIDYLVTEGGLSTHAGSGWTDYDTEDGLVSPVVRRLAFDSAGSLWVAASGGVSRLTNLPNAVYTAETDRALLLFPNPTEAIIQLSVPTTLLGENYAVFDQTGRLRATGLVQTDAQNIDLSILPAGVYVLTVGGVYRRRVVKM